MKTKSDEKKPTAGKKQPAESATVKLPERMDERIEEKIDRDLADSFPASDPPGWTMGVRKPRIKKDKA